MFCSLIRCECVKQSEYFKNNIFSKIVCIVRNDQSVKCKENENTFPRENDNWTTKNSTAAKDGMLSYMTYRSEPKMWISCADNSGCSNVITTKGYRNEANDIART